MVEVQNVEMRFGKKVALQGVSLRLEAGVYGLLGPNGSGKTTLMRCITGILRPTRGSLDVPGMVGYLPQKFGMFRQLTVYEVLEYFAALKKVPGKEQRDIIYDCLKEVNLTDRANDKMGTLSGGMVRRVGIAQTLLGDPAIILFDEPTAGLDPGERLRFLNLVAHVKEGRTVVISTHIVEDVASSCDHIIILNQGRVIMQSTAEELAGHAEGKVYEVPAALRGELRDPYLLLREDMAADTLRVLSDVTQPGNFVSPTVEDGYMYCIGGRT
ncbi:MAG: ATP-binding cassette domain-containing protein [Lachnospiraceae bacterium]|nr:ATP-binding cassette domain-containing protein [Lachnospiraceae bacterium]